MRVLRSREVWWSSSTWASLSSASSWTWSLSPPSERRRAWTCSTFSWPTSASPTSSAQYWWVSYKVYVVNLSENWWKHTNKTETKKYIFLFSGKINLYSPHRVHGSSQHHPLQHCLLFSHDHVIQVVNILIKDIINRDQLEQPGVFCPGLYSSCRGWFSTGKLSTQNHFCNSRHVAATSGRQEYWKVKRILNKRRKLDSKWIPSLRLLALKSTPEIQEEETFIW